MSESADYPDEILELIKDIYEEYEADIRTSLPSQRLRRLAELESRISTEKGIRVQILSFIMFLFSNRLDYDETLFLHPEDQDEIVVD